MLMPMGVLRKRVDDLPESAVKQKVAVTSSGEAPVLQHDTRGLKDQTSR